MMVGMSFEAILMKQMSRFSLESFLMGKLFRFRKHFLAETAARVYQLITCRWKIICLRSGSVRRLSKAQKMNQFSHGGAQ